MKRTNKRAGVPPAPSCNTGALSDPRFLDHIAPLPLPDETVIEQIQRITKHTREMNSMGRGAREGDFRYTHVRGKNMRGLDAEEFRISGRRRPGPRMVATSAADSRAAIKDRK